MPTYVEGIGLGETSLYVDTSSKDEMFEVVLDASNKETPFRSVDTLYVDRLPHLRSYTFLAFGT
jgi:hypothetical protein